METENVQNQGSEQIEFEEILVKMPKAIMNFLREHEHELDEKIEDYLQRAIISVVRADIETNNVFVPSPIELANKYNLQPIFKTFDIEIFYVDS
jgi:hypothetical protein